MAPSISHDGRMAAYCVGLATSSDVWIHDLERDVASRLTLDSQAGEVSPIWTSDGEWVTFASGRGAADTRVFRKRADGAGEAELLVEIDGGLLPQDWSSDDRALLLVRAEPGATVDLVLARFDESGRWNGELEPIAVTDHTETRAQFSPDDRWIAYSSDEAGEMEVYVRAAGDGGRWQISRDGGYEPKWDLARDRILYRRGDAMMAVSFEMRDGRPVFGRPELLMRSPIDSPSPIQNSYDVHPDGRILAMIRPAGREGLQHPVLIQDGWADVAGQ